MWAQYSVFTLVVIRFCYLRRSPWTLKVIVCVTIIAVSYESSVMEARDQGSGQLSTGWEVDGGGVTIMASIPHHTPQHTECIISPPPI